LNLFLVFAGLNLIFGPDQINILVGNLPSSVRSRAAIIGLQLVMQAALGIFAIYTNSAYSSAAYALFGAFNALWFNG